MYKKILPIALIFLGIIIIGMFVFGQSNDRFGLSIYQSSQGGTGTSTTPAADQILIGGSNSRYDVKTLTAGSNVTISTTGGLVTIASTGGTGSIAQLGQIGDVSTTTLAYGSVIRYNTANSKWESVATSTLGISMTYPGAGIALSTGSAWDISITDNSANWDTAYTNRITSATYPLQISSNVISTAIATSTLVPYTGATTDINLGVFSIITSGEYKFGTEPNTLTLARYGTNQFVLGTEAGSAEAVLDLTGITDTKTFTFPNWSGNFLIASSTSLTVSASGNVGIGTTSPYAKLSVVGPAVAEYFHATSTTATSTFSGNTTFGTSDNYGWFDTDGDLNLTGTADYIVKANSYAFRYQPDEDVGLYFSAVNSRFEFLNISGTINAFIGAGTGGANLHSYFINNVGIGTTTPYAKLSVAGEVVGSYFTATSTTATSTFAWGISTNLLSVNSTTATSTFANGINLTNGCFAINGICLTGGTGGSGTVTSVAMTVPTGLTITGSPITTSGTLALTLTAGYTIPTIASTTEWNTALQAPYVLFGQGYAVPATSTAFYFTTARNELTVTNASTTALTVSDLYPTRMWGAIDIGSASSLEIPNSATTLTLDASGEIGIMANTASSSLRFYDGTATRALFDTKQGGFTVASTTLVGNAGTTTIPLGVAYRSQTWLSITCYTDTGTAGIDVGDGTNFIPFISVSTTATPVTLSSNNTFILYEKRQVRIGTLASTPNYVTCSWQYRDNAD